MRARLRLDCDASLSLDIQLIQNLLVASGLDGACELEQSVAKRALAMIDMGDNTEISKSFDWDRGDSLFEICVQFDVRVDF